MDTSLTVVSQGSDSIIISPYAVSDDERTSYYSRITDDGEHPDLLYHTGSDKYLWSPVDSPIGLPSRFVEFTVPRSTTSGALLVPKLTRW